MWEVHLLGFFLLFVIEVSHVLFVFYFNFFNWLINGNCFFLSKFVNVYLKMFIFVSRFADSVYQI